MKQSLFRFLVLFLAIRTLSLLADDGLHYEHRLTNDPLSIHIAWIDPTAFNLRPERALGRGLGRETVTSMALRKGAVAAINGGFFRIGGAYDGDPAGILKIGEIWYSTSDLSRGVVAWKERGPESRIGSLSLKWHVLIGDREYPLDGLNQERGAWTIVAYTSGFNETTLTHAGGLELLVGPEGRVTNVWTGGDGPIPAGGVVISFGSRVPKPKESEVLGQAALLRPALPGESNGRNDHWSSFDYIVGGMPLLIQAGEAVLEYSVGGLSLDFVDGRHPRTALGRRADGWWVLVVVDGRQPKVSIGVTLVELADLMKSLGCVDALNLDGGGSSTFFLFGQVLNHPSDLTGERPVSDAILVSRD